MTLTISMKHRQENSSVTIMVDSEQKIGRTLEVLTEAGVLDGKDSRVVRSVRTRERIHIEKTYREGCIYNGDILVLE